MILQVQQGLPEDGLKVSIDKFCLWFEVPRRTVYYKPTKAAPKINQAYVKPIKAIIEVNPAFGYRT
ncbi:MAG TPA: hypothetical protein VFV28_08490 [Limnobacter sp.]|nr:hypothetical protein [Limnobacter sp.]